MKDRIIEIVELGQFKSLIQREKAPVTELIKTDSLIEELNEQLRKQFSLEDIREAFIAGRKHGEDNACSAEILLMPSEEEYIQSISTNKLIIANVSNMLCGSFDPDTTTSSATKCKCGREKWEHPKAT